MNTELIERLKKTVASPETPDFARQSLLKRIDELEHPKPPAPPAIPDPPKKKCIDFETLPHAKYIKKNNINASELPVKIKRKINCLRAFIGKDSEKVRAKAPEISKNIIELLKTHLSPPPPEPECTDEEIESYLSQYASKNKSKRQIVKDEEIEEYLSEHTRKSKLQKQI